LISIFVISQAGIDPKSDSGIVFLQLLGAIFSIPLVAGPIYLAISSLYSMSQKFRDKLRMKKIESTNQMKKLKKRARSL